MSEATTLERLSVGEYFRVSRRLGLNARSEFIVLVLLIVAAGFEGIGIGMFLPIVQFVTSDGDLSGLAAQGDHWKWLIEAFNWIDLEPTLGPLILVSFASILLRQLIVYVRQVYMAKLREWLNFRNRNLGFQRFIEADTDYQDATTSGVLVNSFTTELRYAIDAILLPVQIISYTFNALFYLGLLLFLAGPITMVSMLVIGVSAFSLRSLLVKTLHSGDQFADANESMSDFLVERLSVARLIRLSGMEQAEVAEMRRHTERQLSSMINMQLYLARVNVLMEPVAIAVGFLALYLGVNFFGLKLEEIGIFVLIAVMRLLPVIKEIMQTGQASLGYLSSLRQFIARLEAMETARENRGGGAECLPPARAIYFDNVGYTYEMRDDAPALRNLDLNIEAGKTTAIVGPSGAGKSTLLDLIPRLRDPSRGAVRFDDRDIRDYSVFSLRDQIAYVSQAPLIFNVTIAEQIGYGKDNATMDDIRKAADLAGAVEFIEQLPQKFDTVLNQGGVNLSGGQLQRIDLARALVKSAPILILDEPTSNLDANSEDIFRQTLAKIGGALNVTIIVVAHRLSTVAGADKIIVLKDGYVDDVATHSELMSADGWYADVYRKQHNMAPPRESEEEREKPTLA